MNGRVVCTFRAENARQVPVGNNDCLIVRNIITDVTCSFRSAERYYRYPDAGQPRPPGPMPTSRDVFQKSSSLGICMKEMRVRATAAIRGNNKDGFILAWPCARLDFELRYLVGRHGLAKEITLAELALE